MTCLGLDGLSPDLAWDKQQLLAMQDQLRRSNDRLLRNCQSHTPVREFDGIIVAGVPPRVTTLEWNVKGLDGVIQGRWYEKRRYEGPILSVPWVPFR